MHVLIMCLSKEHTADAGQVPFSGAKMISIIYNSKADSSMTNVRKACRSLMDFSGKRNHINCLKCVLPADNEVDRPICVI